jgi:hypothetical protein
MGPPTKLITALANKFEVNYFIETGTYYGGTAKWASEIFDQVFTIEYSKTLFAETKQKYNHLSNIQFLLGDSRQELEKLINQLDNPSIFWLDAHWSGGKTYGQNDQCPLIEEIKVLNRSRFDNFIFIDDARLFTSPPQPPHNVEEWADIATIIDTLRENHQRYIVIIEDVIIAVPIQAKPVVVEYCQEVNARAWKEQGKPRLTKATELIYLEIKYRFNKTKSIVKQIIRKSS